MTGRGEPVVPTDRDEIYGSVEYLRGVAGDGGARRDVVVWLPPGYHERPERRYPVLYMHDGHNLVDPATSYTIRTGPDLWPEFIVGVGSRLAPFPDFNLLFAWLAMNAFLLAKGYPTLLPERGDRALLARIAIAPPPRRIVQFESRLLDAARA